MIDYPTYFTTGKPLVMGIVNATGDSFSEGSLSSASTALDRGLLLLDEGADLLDIGGESTRPGSACVPVGEEISRVVPLVKELKKLRPGCVISVDTRKSAVAEAAVEAGADILNDVSMLRYDDRMAEVAAASEVPLILAHSRGTPENMMQLCQYTGDVVQCVLDELLAAREKAEKCGVSKIVLDPNFGFAKNSSQNWEILRRIDRFTASGPVLAGVSRKQFIGDLTGETVPANRLGGTLSCVLYLADRGVSVLRVHDVRQVCDALKVHRFLRGEES